MSTLFQALTRRADRPRTVIVVDEDGVEGPQQYRFRPRAWLWGGIVVVIVLAAGLAALALLSPLRNVIYGPDADALRLTASRNALRASALVDSLEVQRQYVLQLRALITGELDTSFARFDVEGPPDIAEPGGALEVPSARTDDWEDHQQPAVPIRRLSDGNRAPVTPAAAARLAALRFPALPPVEGFLARGFDARIGHLAIDLAVEEGTPVRAIGDGYVVAADWTHDGGYTIAVQHADGYLSVYKHNARLLKRSGDRVRSRETLAVSGNSGEITTGPHLHFELWHDGLAQDPRAFLLGL